jgi:hypothetical protein
MTILEIVAVLVAAALGWASGALKAHLHSLRRPPSSLGSDCRPGLAVLAEPAQPREAPRNEQKPHAARQRPFA